MVYDDDVMEFVLETGKDSLHFLDDCALKPGLFTCPVESIALAVFFGKH